jgi:hypothetical protein
MAWDTHSWVSGDPTANKNFVIAARPLPMDQPAAAAAWRCSITWSASLPVISWRWSNW